MNQTRYQKLYKQISPVEALARRDRAIEDFEDQVKYAENALAEAIDNLNSAKEAPLETGYWIYESLQPNDDGYDEAPVAFHESNYAGDIAWINIPNTPNA